MNKDMSKDKLLKEVVILDPSWSYSTIQSFYIDYTKCRLKPNVVILKPPEMTLYLQINSHGFKGSEIDFSKKLVAVWGDSVIFSCDCVEKLSSFFSNYQFLNGGIEGDNFENICTRILEGNYSLGIRIDYNIIFPGWHSLKVPKRVNDLLYSMVKSVPNPILCTVPTSLNEKVVEVGLDAYFINTPHDIEKMYGFWGNLPYSKENAKTLLAELIRQNDIVRSVASRCKVPLIDLYPYFYTYDSEDFRQDFFDAGHLRPSAYPKMQKAFYEGLKDVII